VVEYALKAVCGGVVRTTNGEFVIGFSRNLGNCSITIVEHWAIYQGLQLAKSRGYPRIWTESDSKTRVPDISSHSTKGKSSGRCFG
jgi:ribonuclease HI